MNVILNIGLDEPALAPGETDVGPVLRANAALDWLRARIKSGHCYLIDVGLPSACLVFQGDLPLEHWTDLHSLSEALQQDCIAVWSQGNGKGFLIGPGRRKWGSFDVSKFRWTPPSRDTNTFH